MTALEYFRRCIALCRAHNLTRIEVGNHYMVAWNRLYMNEIEGALEDALVAGGSVDAAVRVGHRRGGHLGVAEDGRPFAEGQVGGDDDRGALVEPADEVEQQLASGLGEGQVASSSRMTRSRRAS